MPSVPFITAADVRDSELLADLEGQVVRLMRERDEARQRVRILEAHLAGEAVRHAKERIERDKANDVQRDPASVQPRAVAV